MDLFAFFRRRPEPAPTPPSPPAGSASPAESGMARFVMPEIPEVLPAGFRDGRRAAGALAAGDRALVTAVEASIPDAKRLVEQCEEAGIHAVLGGEECCSSGGCAPKAAVRVARADVPRVKLLLEQLWAADLEREGVDPAALAKVAAAERSGKPHCPACGHIGALVGGACADCGLQLS